MSSFSKKSGSGRNGSSPRKSKNTYVTKSGQAIKLNQNLAQKFQARRADKAQRKAERLAGMPKSRLKRFAYRMHPKRLYKYWFSREGGIMALKILGIGILAGFVVLIGVFAYFRKDLPNLRDISGNNIGGSIRYYDKSHTVLLWEDYDAVKRIPVKDQDMSTYIKQATVAVEDKDFFKHGGFDVRGIVRAGLNNTIGHGGTQGGSTITQQLVKLNNDWTKDRTVKRKVKELILSVELERSYSKQEILTGYLNAAPYGGVDYGVEAAARDYYNKSAKDLTLEEAVMLAAIPKSPSYYSPYSPSFDKEALAGRMEYILNLMQEQGMISKTQVTAAKKVDVASTVKPRRPKYDGIKAPWFVLAAKEELEKNRGTQTVKQGGFTVTTTLDMNLQNIAEDQVNKGMNQVRRQGGDTAGFVAEDVKTGQVVALVGGSDFTNPVYGQNNYAADYRLPPGSSFKPYDYISLMENTTNTGAGSVLYDTQGPLDGYPCTNKANPKQGGNCLWDYDFRYPGPLTLRYALGGSRNVPAVKAMLTVGVDKTIGVAEKLMGNPKGYQCYQDEQFTKPGPCYASSAIGDGAYLKMTDHVNGYASISRNGSYIPQTFILKIEDAANKPVYEWKQAKGEQAVRADSAYIVADMMSDPNASYFPAGRKPHRYKGWKFAMKTGTTNDGKDGWMMGFSTQYAAGVWVGYHNRQKVMSGTMENMTQPIWQGWMNKAHDNLKPEDRVKPASVQSLPAYVVRSHVGIGSVEPSPTNDLFPSWYKKPGKTNSSAKTIDIVSNKLATDCTPERAKKQLTDADSNSFSSDRFAGQNGAQTDQKDDVHVCGDTPPSVDVSESASGISATAHQGTHPLNDDQYQYKGTINFIVGGQIVQSFNVSDGQTVILSTSSYASGAEVTVQIIDSVLYDGQKVLSSTSYGSSGSGGGSTTTGPTIVSAVKQGSFAKITWTGGSGSVQAFRNSDDSPLCPATLSGSCTTTITVPVGTVVYIKDTANVKSATATVGP